MKIVIRRGGGLGDIVCQTLLNDEFGKLFSLIANNHEVHLILDSHNTSDKDWYSWIPYLSIHRMGFGVFSKEDILKYYPGLVNAEWDFNFHSVEPIQFDYPEFDLPKFKTVVHPFAGTTLRSVFAEDILNFLDKKENVFIGKSNTRQKGVGESPLTRHPGEGDAPVEKLPSLRNATNTIDRLNIMEVFQLIRSCELLMGTHSVFLHMARCLGKKTIGIVPKYVAEDESFLSEGYMTRFSVLGYPETRNQHTIFCSENLEGFKSYVESVS